VRRIVVHTEGESTPRRPKVVAEYALAGDSAFASGSC
jgi:hypothetical protein